MQVRVCTSVRKRYLLFVKTLDDFISKVKQVLSLDEDFRCVLEEDGSEISNDVLGAILMSPNEKIGVVMVLKEGEQWTNAASATEDSAMHASFRAVPAMPTLCEQPKETVQVTSNKRSFRDVRTFLENSAKGQRVLGEYDRHGTLCSESRQTLVKIAVAQLVEDCGPYPSKEQKAELGLAIVASLPGLKDRAGATGFEHFFHESNGQTGYIQDRLKRIRRSLGKDQQQRPRKQPKASSGKSSEPISGGCELPDGEPVTDELSANEVEKLTSDCLYANPAADQAVILSCMAKTAAARQLWIRKDRPSITEVMEKYPRLEDVPLHLLDIDFRIHFPSAVGTFTSEFPSWVKGILAAARLSERDNITDLLRQYDSEEHSDTVSSRDLVYSILLLLQLLPSSNTRQNGKVSAVELGRCLITFKPVQTCIKLFVAQKIQKQPFLLCLGSAEELGIFYLLLDTKAVCLGGCGILRAVDALFKSHYVYWVDYSKPLVFFMEFLQKLIYKIECSKLSARVREVNNSIIAVRSKGEQSRKD